MMTPTMMNFEPRGLGVVRRLRQFGWLDCACRFFGICDGLEHGAGTALWSQWRCPQRDSAPS